MQFKHFPGNVVLWMRKDI